MIGVALNLSCSRLTSIKETPAFDIHYLNWNHPADHGRLVGHGIRIQDSGFKLTKWQVVFTSYPVYDTINYEGHLYMESW